MTMKTFGQYRRKQKAELRPVDVHDIQNYDHYAGNMPTGQEKGNWVSISDEDKKNGSPKIGDMIARNPKNHCDQWLVAKQYFEDNFEPIR